MGLLNLIHKKQFYDQVKDIKLLDLEDSNKREDLVRKAWRVREVRTFFEGKKTYIVAGLAAAVQLGVILGYIPQALADQLMQLLGAGAVATVAAKLNRINLNQK